MKLNTHKPLLPLPLTPPSLYVLRDFSGFERWGGYPGVESWVFDVKVGWGVSWGRA